MSSRNIRDILQLWRTAAALARSIGKRPDAVRQWFRPGRTPPPSCAHLIAREAQKLGHAWCTTDVVLEAIQAARDAAMALKSLESA